LSETTTALRFADITGEAGIDFVHETGAFGEKWMPETMGSGGGFLDFDGDGWLDILLVNGMDWPGHESSEPRATLALYRNLGDGTFRDVTSEVGLAVSLYGMGAAFADYDGDRDVDVFVTAVGSNKLFRNDGGTFTDVSLATGVAGGRSAGRESLAAWSTGAAWLDYDRDGWVDLFVCNYVRWTPETDLYATLDGSTKSYATPEQYEGESCELYRNRNGLRFEDVTRVSGVYDPAGKSLGLAVYDFDDDGWLDVVVANDTEHNFLYLNQADGTFADVAIGSGIGYDEYGRARAGMGIDVAEVVDAGRESIVIGNFSQEPLSLYTQLEEGLFQDLAGQARLTGPSLLRLTFGVAFVDLDLDGRLDLVTANGHIEPTINDVQQNITFDQRPQAFLNAGDGTFVEVSETVGDGFAAPVVGRGVAYGDIDRDGDPDLLITVNGGRPIMLRNDLAAAAENTFVLELRGRPPNTGALGAVVTLYTGDMRQKRLVRTGSSYLSQSDFGSLLFGLGTNEKVDSIRVRWPTTAQVKTFGGVSGGFRYVAVEGETVLQSSGALVR